MLGSIHDAEDLVQETYLRAWRAFDRFEGRSSVRRWLYAIATMACLTALETRARRPLPSGLGAPSDDHRVAVAPAEPSVPWLQPAPDALLGDPDPAAVVAPERGVRLAFIAALQHLPARQRAVLTLRDVLAFRTAEVAEMLDTTPAAVDSALRRARAHLAAGRTGRGRPGRARRGRPQRLLLDAYVDAFTRADAGALVDLLRADVEMEMPPIPTWFTGRARRGRVPGRRVLRDGGPVADAADPGQRPARCRRAQGARTTATRRTACRCSTLLGGRIARITAFNDPGLVPTFDVFAARQGSS